MKYSMTSTHIINVYVFEEFNNRNIQKVDKSLSEYVHQLSILSNVDPAWPSPAQQDNLSGAVKRLVWSVESVSGVDTPAHMLLGQSSKGKLANGHGQGYRQEQRLFGL